jgi:hypothetical protein
MDGSVPVFRLGERGGDGLCCDARGVGLGPVALVEAAEARGRRVYRLRPAEQIARTLALAYGAFGADDLARRLSVLEVAAPSLEAGDLAKAMIAALQMKLPPLAPEAVAKLVREPTLRKYSPDQPRDERGRWTEGSGSASGDADTKPTAAKPVQVAANDTGTMSDAGGMLPAPTDSDGEVPAPPPGTGKVREYSPEEAAKLPPPPAGSKYVTLNDGSVLWDGYLNGGKGGPMLMPENVSLAADAKDGEQLRASYEALLQSAPDAAGVFPGFREGAMLAWFVPGSGSKDYQSLDNERRNIDPKYVDMTNYNYGVVAAAAGYSKEEMLAAAGIVNVATDLVGRVRDDKPKDTSGPEGNKVRNVDMMQKGYDDYVAGRITPRSR